MYQVMEIKKIIGIYKNVIIVGHHPIVRTRLKDKKIKVGSDIPSFAHTLSQIFIPGKNYYYLCSDLHLFQNGTITIPTERGNMIIQQMIVGTGGTELDESIKNIKNIKINFPYVKSGKDGCDKCIISVSDNDKIYKYDLDYTVYNDIETCGFLECDFESDPTFKFISVEDKKSLNLIPFSVVDPNFPRHSQAASHEDGAAAAALNTSNGGSRRRRVRKTKRNRTENKKKRMHTRIVRKMKRSRKNKHRRH